MPASMIRGCALLLTIVLLAGCGSSNPSSSGSNPSRSSESTTSSTHHRTRHHRSRSRSRSHRSRGSGSRTSPVATGPSRLLGPRSKTSGCRVRGALPDSACTPGAAFAKVTVAQICKLGYSRGVRNVTSSTKRRAYLEYGIRSHRAGQYEIDHLVSLELGGSNVIANLWPEAASPEPGFHQKDMVENYLHDQVCSGHMSLQQAQRDEAANWLAIYHNMGH
jgi:hypothetical protein